MTVYIGKCECGHIGNHHHRANDERDICDALVSRVPLTYCPCKKFKAVNDG